MEKENYKYVDHDDTYYVDYDDGHSIQDFDSSFEEYYECNNPNAAFLHDNGMVWDNRLQYIGRFIDGEFVKKA